MKQMRGRQARESRSHHKNGYCPPFRHCFLFGEALVLISGLFLGGAEGCWELWERKILLDEEDKVDSIHGHKRSVAV